MLQLHEKSFLFRRDKSKLKTIVSRLPPLEERRNVKVHLGSGGKSAARGQTRDQDDRPARQGSQGTQIRSRFCPARPRSIDVVSRSQNSYVLCFRFGLGFRFAGRRGD